MRRNVTKIPIETKGRKNLPVQFPISWGSRRTISCAFLKVSTFANYSQTRIKETHRAVRKVSLIPSFFYQLSY